MEEEKKTLGLSADNRAKFMEAFLTLQECLFRINEGAGWHDPPPTDAECVANVHGEVSEINEWMRMGPEVRDDKIPEFLGVEAEGADVVIRLMNWYKRKEWRLAEAILAKAEYNASRPYRHGNKKF